MGKILGNIIGNGIIKCFSIATFLFFPVVLIGGFFGSQKLIDIVLSEIPDETLSTIALILGGTIFFFIIRSFVLESQRGRGKSIISYGILSPQKEYGGGLSVKDEMSDFMIYEPRVIRETPDGLVGDYHLEKRDVPLDTATPREMYFVYIDSDGNEDIIPYFWDLE